MSKEMNKDLTKGNPIKVLWMYCLPLFGSIVFQQLYNLADSIVAGKFISSDPTISENAVAAVGNSYEITLIFIAFAFGCNIGCSVIVARLFAQKKYEDLKTAIFTTFIFSAALCVILMTLGLTLSGKLLTLINTADEIFNDSKVYLDIYIYSLPFVFFYNVATGIFSALGDSKTPFFFLMASSLSNIGMDILFVAVFKMGVAGVAWATFLCQGISCILAVLFVLLRIRKIPSEGKAAIFSLRIFRQIVVIAVPSILQQSFISVGNIFIQSIVNSFGASVTAGYSATIKLHNLVVTAFTTLANGISSYTSQNLGAGKRKRIAQGFAAGVGIVWVLCVPIVLLYLLAGKYLMLIFMQDSGSEAVAVGVQLLRVVVPFYFVVSVKLVADGVLRGEGKMVKFMISTFSDLILRVVLATILSPLLGTLGIWWAWPIGWGVGTILSLLFLAVDAHLAKKKEVRLE